MTHAAALRRLAGVNLLSFLAQIVQISTVPALLALRLGGEGASSTTVGVVAAAPWLAILLLGRKVPLLLRWLGFIRTNALAALLALGSTLAIVYVEQLWLLWCANFVFGLGLILRWVACDTWIVALAPAELRGRAIGTHETLMGCGIAAGPMVLGLVGTGGTAPLMACLVLLAVSASVLVPLRRADGHPLVPEAGAGSNMLRIVPAAVAAGFLAGFIETSSVSFLPLLGDRGALLLGATLVLGAFGAGGTLLQLPLGWLADRIGFRRAQGLAALGVLCGAVAILGFSQFSWPLAAALFVFGGVAGGLNTLAVVEAGQRVDERATSTAMMAIAMAYTAGSIVGPVATGVLLKPLPTAGFTLTIATGALLYLLLWWRAARRDRRAGAATAIAASAVAASENHALSALAAPSAVSRLR